MTNHVHLIVSNKDGRLSDTIRDLKKFTARKILQLIKEEPESRREWMVHRFEWNAAQNKRSSNNQFWTHENHAIELTSYNFFMQKLNYIHLNPLRAGWVRKEEDYIYSSAQALCTNTPSVLPLCDWYE